MNIFVQVILVGSFWFRKWLIYACHHTHKHKNWTTQWLLNENKMQSYSLFFSCPLTLFDSIKSTNFCSQFAQWRWNTENFAQNLHVFINKGNCVKMFTFFCCAHTYIYSLFFPPDLFVRSFARSLAFFCHSFSFIFAFVFHLISKCEMKTTWYESKRIIIVLINCGCVLTLMFILPSPNLFTVLFIYFLNWSWFFSRSLVTFPLCFWMRQHQMKPSN